MSEQRGAYAHGSLPGLSEAMNEIVMGECEHGNPLVLKRKCPECQHEHDKAELRAEIGRLRATLPLATEDQRKGGWTIAPEYLYELQEKISHFEDSPSWEGIELVLLAHYGMELPKSEEE